jgi:hypothetical protein
MGGRGRALRLAAILLGVFAAGLVYVGLACRYRLPPWNTVRAAYRLVVPKPPKTVWPAAGRWHRVEEAAAGASQPDGALEEALAALRALGYVEGSRPAHETSGVVLYDPDRAYAGLNLYVSAHAPEAFLIDMQGETVHRWGIDFPSVWPEHPPSEENRYAQYWRRAFLLEDGDLLAIHENLGLVRLDRDSNVLWKLGNHAHHDVAERPDGGFYVLVGEPRLIPRINPQEPVVEDFVAVVSEDGRELRRVSLLEAFERSPYALLLENMESSGDIFHTNTLELLDGRLADRLPAFRAGRLLVSVWGLDAIAVVDLDTEAVVWALTGMWRRQHQPTVLDSGNLLLFDNRGHHGRSKVIEFDPLTQSIVWAYEGDASNGFYSEWCGSAQRLPNGNTLVTESDGGRAFEVTPDGHVVWMFHNPHRTGERQELVATLFEVVRVPPERARWLER